jgi:hypothetical protein
MTKQQKQRRAAAHAKPKLTTMIDTSTTNSKASAAARRPVAVVGSGFKAAMAMLLMFGLPMADAPYSDDDV